MKIRPLAISFAAMSLLALAVFAQQSQPSQTSTDTTGSRGASGATTDDTTLQQNLQEILEEPDSGDTYHYDPQGRRDPFRSLIGPSPKINRENAPPGPPGFLIEEINLIGVVRGKQGMTAMIKGPDNNGYLLHAGDKVFDGEVIRVTAGSVVFRQEVNDPTRIERYREVVKDLVPPSGEEKKP